MAGITLTARDTEKLQEVVAALAEVGPEPIPWEALEGLAELLHTDEVSLGGYRSSGCSSPDRSGDHDPVTLLSDFTSLRERRRTAVPAAAPEREMPAGVRLTPARQLRVVGWRHEGPDVTERDRFLLRLLRPHVQDYYERWRRQHPAANHLTPRQLAVLALVRDGYTNGQIGRRLHLSEGTVRTHLNNVYERLGVQSRTAAVAAVYRDAG